MSNFAICCFETYVKASFFSGIALFVLNTLQFLLSVAFGLQVNESTETYFDINFSILACLTIGLLMSTCLMFGAYGDGRRSGAPFLATIVFAIVQLGLYLGLTVPIINDVPIIDNRIWVWSCIGMAIADFWTIYVAFKAKKEISRIMGYQEIA